MFSGNGVSDTLRLDCVTRGVSIWKSLEIPSPPVIGWPDEAVTVRNLGLLEFTGAFLECSQLSEALKSMLVHIEVIP